MTRIMETTITPATPTRNGAWKGIAICLLIFIALAAIIGNASKQDDSPASATYSTESASDRRETADGLATIVIGGLSATDLAAICDGIELDPALIRASIASGMDDTGDFTATELTDAAMRRLAQVC